MEGLSFQWRWLGLLSSMPCCGGQFLLPDTWVLWKSSSARGLLTIVATGTWQYWRIYMPWQHRQPLARVTSCAKGLLIIFELWGVAEDDTYQHPPRCSTCITEESLKGIEVEDFDQTICVLGLGPALPRGDSIPLRWHSTVLIRESPSFSSGNGSDSQRMDTSTKRAWQCGKG